MSRREFGRYSMGACVFAVGLDSAAGEPHKPMS